MRHGHTVVSCSWCALCFRSDLLTAVKNLPTQLSVCWVTIFWYGQTAVINFLPFIFSLVSSSVLAKQKWKEEVGNTRVCVCVLCKYLVMQKERGFSNEVSLSEARTLDCFYKHKLKGQMVASSSKQGSSFLTSESLRGAEGAVLHWIKNPVVLWTSASLQHPEVPRFQHCHVFLFSPHIGNDSLQKFAPQLRVTANSILLGELGPPPRTTSESAVKRKSSTCNHFICLVIVFLHGLRFVAV